MGLIVDYKDIDGKLHKQTYLKIIQVTFVNDKTIKLPNVEYGIWKSKEDADANKPPLIVIGTGNPDYQFKNNEDILKDFYIYLKKTKYPTAVDLI